MRFFGRKPRGADAGAAVPDVGAVLRASGLVDEAWYRTEYPEAATTGSDAVDDYVAGALTKGRNPNAFFDSRWYLDANEDVRVAGINPLWHYIVAGAAEGRSAGPAFDTAYYLALYPEVEAAGVNPLLHFLRNGRVEGRLATPLDEGDAFEVGVKAKQQAMSGGARALFYGSRADHVHFPLERRSEATTGGLPLPPLRLARRIGSVTLEDFDASGRDIRNAIMRALPEGFSLSGKRCLDFGCGVGRTLRHFGEAAQDAEFWGCDIDGPSIRWCVQHLSPPFRFFQISEVPTIPFEDNSFDLVYAISVLSHIHSTWHQWLMEIRRILKPGGTVVVSFMGQNPMEAMLGEPYWARGADFGMYVKGPHHNWNDGGPMIFVSPEWIKRFWGSLFDIDYIAMEGLMDDQSFCVMRKPAVGAPIRRDVPVLRLTSRQEFNPDATGRISPQVDEAKPFVDSYGLDVAAKPDVVVEGWIVFRDDEPADLTADVDGRPSATEWTFEHGPPYRDWNARQCAFNVTIDLADQSAGEHELAVTLTSAAGRSHCMTIPLLIH